MAVVQNPIIGRSKNKLANVIFSTWIGKNVLRSKPLSVANPRTTLQIRNRLRIAYLAEMAKSLREIINVTYAPLRNGKTQYNAFARANYPLINDTDSDDPAQYYIILNDLKVGLQNLEGGANISYSNTNDTFNLALLPTQVRNNMRVFFAYFFQSNTASQKGVAFKTIEVSYAGENTIQVPEDLNATSVIAVFYNTVDRTSYSFAVAVN